MAPLTKAMRFSDALNVVWKELPLYKRPMYLMRAGFTFGLFWIEVASALIALGLSVTALKDLNWQLDESLTRYFLVAVFLGHVSYLFSGSRNGYWLRLLGVGLGASWWAGVSTIFFFQGVLSLGILFFVLFVLCFADLISLGSGK